MDITLASFSESVLEYVAKIIAPESILAQARGEVKMTQAEIDQTTKIVEQDLQAGDIILNLTPAPIFDLFRDMSQTKYDHIVAVVDEKRSLHISYPYAKLVPTILFV